MPSMTQIWVLLDVIYFRRCAAKLSAEWAGAHKKKEQMVKTVGSLAQTGLVHGVSGRPSAK